MASDARKLLRNLMTVDRRAAVWCAAQCARTALFVLPDGEHRPLKAIETAEAWVSGEATQERCAKAGKSAYRAREAADPEGPGYIVEAVATAAIAASSTANAAVKEIEYAAECAATAVESAYIARAMYEREARKPIHAELFDLISSIRWPVTTPTPEQLSAAEPAIKAAWDALVNSDLQDLPIPGLFSAYDRAKRLGLDWSDPVARAIAERTNDEA